VRKLPEAGNYFMEKLLKLSEKYDSIRQVRGRGLMIGVEVAGNGKEIVERMRDRRILVNLTGSGSLLYPAADRRRTQVDEVIAALSDVLRRLPGGMRMNKDFLRISHLTPDEGWEIIDRAKDIKTVT